MRQSDKTSQGFDQSIYLYFKSDNVYGKPPCHAMTQAGSHQSLTAQVRPSPSPVCMGFMVDKVMQEQV